MDYSQYKNEMAYPLKANFTVTYFYKQGVTIAKKHAADGGFEFFVPGVSKQDLQSMIKEQSIDEAAFKVARQEYHAESARLENQFTKDLFAELGIENNPKRFKLYAKAYEMGHSAGLAEVYSYAADLVELIQE